MPLQATSGAASYDAFGGGVPAVPAYIEEVFSTWLYTGNSTSGGTQTITNNIDLSTKGGMVWIKGRSAASDHILTDTTRGAGTTASNNQALSSNLTTAEDLGASYDFLSAFNTTGFAVTQGGATAATRGTNYNNVTYASWTFREQPKFFDVVTYTGNGVQGRQISHALGSTPGCIIVKCTSTTSNWTVYHRSLTTNYILQLNSSTSAINVGSPNAYVSAPTDTTFTVGNDSDVNSNGATYVAYLFAHDAGGFGLTGTDNVISCGSYTGNGTSSNAITLGYEPQWIMVKKTSATGPWLLFDTMRGWSLTAQRSFEADAATIEYNFETQYAGVPFGSPTATGFNLTSDYTATNASGATYIYIAIRRGPMKVPTSGTSVFGLSARTGTGANATVTGGQTDDAVLVKNRGSAVASLFSSRLTGTGYLVTSSTAAEVAAGVTILQANPWDVMDGVKVGTTSTITNASTNTYINYLFRRAPSFFDEVCYTGTGSATTISHNLGVAPELMIVKSRSLVKKWPIYSAATGPDYVGVLNTTADFTNPGANEYWDTAPTASVFTVKTNGDVNTSAATYVAYLFATCAGVSKVGSYTGTGTTLQINCGFTGGARFVLIKKTSGTGSWYVWDSSRGIVSGNDPYLLLNSTAAEVTNTDYIDTYSAGFEISSTAPSEINENGGSFIFLAIA